MCHIQAMEETDEFDLTKIPVTTKALTITHWAGGSVLLSDAAHTTKPNTMLIVAGPTDFHTEGVGHAESELWYNIEGRKTEHWFRAPTFSEVPVTLYTAGKLLDHVTVDTSWKANIIVKALVARRINCLASAGNIAVSGLQQGMIHLKTHSGNITVKGINSYKGAISCQTVNGKIMVNGQPRSYFLRDSADNESEVLTMPSKMTVITESGTIEFKD